MLILASASPRRADLLRMLGIPFTIQPSNVSEDLDVALDPASHVLKIAARKAKAVAAGYQKEMVLGADTVVSLDDAILEKPVDREDAANMLARLSGTTHQVYTGLVLIDTSTGTVHSDVAATQVTMRQISPEEIAGYVKTDEPMDKAGAYAAQGRAAVFVESVSGCFYNVVGLPLVVLWELMTRVLGAPPVSMFSGGDGDLVTPRGS
jgi:septum formation protein